MNCGVCVRLLVPVRFASLNWRAYRGCVCHSQRLKTWTSTLRKWPRSEGQSPSSLQQVRLSSKRSLVWPSTNVVRCEHTPTARRKRAEGQNLKELTKLHEIICEFTMQSTSISSNPERS